MAARRGDLERVWQHGPFETAHHQLCTLARDNDLLVGHNLHRFDRARIAERAPTSPLLRLPTLDTLELSVLAFPRRPYHRLVKDDQLVRDALPRPLSDVRASEKLLSDAIDALSRLDEREAALLSALLSHLDVPDHARRGWRWLARQLGWPWHPHAPLDLASAWRDRVCTHSPALRSPRVDVPLLMVAAWLHVARHDDGSVLPAWVRRTWPQTPSLIRSLRATPCDDDHCPWCSTHLDPDHWLREVFGFDAYRDQPAAPDGTSLQRLLVDRGLRGLPTFGILPTGGGKSLCFQVPAEARHRLLGQLTVVISPLQSLMKDQVDSLKQRIPHARAIYGGLPSLVRPQVMDEVRTGECGLLYLSPEQFRNASILRLLGQRELGAIVFDEAHCLSQWGHDFRTDYPYVLKAVRELMEHQGAPMPPVFLYTATTQHDATHEIIAHVRDQCGWEVQAFDGGSARDNLTYEVRQVPEHRRHDVVVELLVEHLGSGTAIVFCGSRRRTESTASALTEKGFPAEAYHAGLKPDERRDLQDAFLRGEHRIITATNAFGMGVDKDDVRLVVHLDMPSSLEAYLQEAGRAGRDRKPAAAVLLWSPGDADSRFALGSLGDLTAEDLQALWRAICQLPARTDRDTERRVVTPRELLYQEALQGHFDPLDASDETRVKAAVNWLERGKVLQRKENRTSVFTGRPLRPTLDEARAAVDDLGLQPARAVQWKQILVQLYDAQEEGLSADELAVLCQEMSYEDPLEGGSRVLGILQQMVDRRLVSAGQTFSAFVAKGVPDSSSRRLRRWQEREERVVASLAEEGVPDNGQVHLRVVAERLSTEASTCSANEVALLLGTWSSVVRGLSPEPTSARFRHRRSDVGFLSLDLRLSQLGGLLRLRREIAAKALEVLLDGVEGQGKQLLVSSVLEDLVRAVATDLVLGRRLLSPVEAVRSAIAWLHELRIITVQSGLAIFRSAMRLDRKPHWPGLGDEEAREAVRALHEHQLQRILRVHVMEAWAKTMLDRPHRAERLRADWFALPIRQFTAKWFPRQKAQVERPTTPESYRAIVTDLRDPVQQAIVTRDMRRNHLVLAGPGSGKTRVLVHRIAWLLRVHRVRARQILVVCYTRANALELRRRLHELVDRDADRVSIRTLHSVAMSMVGAHRLGPDGDLDLDSCIRVAASMLRGDALDTTEQIRQRDALLRGIEYLFVDEYQDIDADKYALLSAIAGRAMEGDQRKLRVFAVGDDDQAIFTYDGASTDFIRDFESDYRAHRFVIPHSYRNPRAVLELAQALVAPLPDRLKEGTTLVVDPARADDPAGGPWAQAHPDLRGRMVWHLGTSVRDAAQAAMDKVSEWLGAGVEPTSIGVLARTRRHGLHPLRIAAEAARVPFTWPLPSESTVPVGRIREVVHLLDLLETLDDWTPSGVLERELDQLGTGPWTQALRDWLEPNLGRRWMPSQWTYDLLSWVRLERRARTLGQGVHLGTMHSAKGLEFDHVLVLDDGTMDDSEEHRRLLYVALTRARRSLQIFSSDPPSAVFAALRHPLLEVRRRPPLAADAPPAHDYGLLGRDAIWIDWLGRQPEGHPGHRAMERARPGDPFTLAHRGERLAIVDGDDQAVALLSAKGLETWQRRVEQGLRLRLVAAIRERATDSGREESYRSHLRADSWWTGVWEGRWRA